VVSELHARIAELQAELEAERGTRQGKMRNLLGQMGQAFIGYVMLRGFRNQTVRGEFFGVEGNVFLPHFARVFPTFVQAEGSEGHQIDNHGLPRERRHPHWVTEQKSWEEPVGVAEVDTFLRAVEEFREVKGVEEVVGWMYAKSGFTDPARALLRERGVLHSDLEQVCGLMEAAGLV
jgi:hypothetical protein